MCLCVVNVSMCSLCVVYVSMSSLCVVNVSLIFQLTGSSAVHLHKKRFSNNCDRLRWNLVQLVVERMMKTMVLVLYGYAGFSRCSTDYSMM